MEIWKFPGNEEYEQAGTQLAKKANLHSLSGPKLL